MRYAVVILTFALLPHGTVAQADLSVDTSSATEVTGVEYTRLDHLSFNRANIFSGDQGQVSLSLVELRNVDTGQVLKGVEVNVSKRSSRVVGGSLALASVGSLFGASSEITYRRIRNSGHVFLRGQDLAEVVSFLDKTIQAIGRKQTQMKIYKVSLQRGFEIGMMYDPSAPAKEQNDPQARPRWKFIVTANEATYRLDYQDGLDVVRRLGQWQKQLPEQ